MHNLTQKYLIRFSALHCIVSRSPVPTVEASPGWLVWTQSADIDRGPGSGQWLSWALQIQYCSYRGCRYRHCRYSDNTADTVTILQTLQHTAATMGEEVVLTAWQLYTALFVLFWAAQLYFSSFWMSVLCCVKVSYETNIVF